MMKVFSISLMRLNMSNSQSCRASKMTLLGTKTPLVSRLIHTFSSSSVNLDSNLPDNNLINIHLNNLNMKNSNIVYRRIRIIHITLKPNKK